MGNALLSIKDKHWQKEITIQQIIMGVCYVLFQIIEYTVCYILFQIVYDKTLSGPYRSKHMNKEDVRYG